MSEHVCYSLTCDWQALSDSVHAHVAPPRPPQPLELLPEPKREQAFYYNSNGLSTETRTCLSIAGKMQLRGIRAGPGSQHQPGTDYHITDRSLAPYMVRSFNREMETDLINNPILSSPFTDHLE